MRIAGRTRALCCALAGTAVLLLAPTVATGESSAGSRAAAAVDPALTAAVVEQVNAVRRDAGLRSLRVSKALWRAAREHVLSMAELGYFSHSSADGSSPTNRILSFYSVNGATSWAVGEVLAWARGSLSAGRALELWLASPSHRAEILGRRWREVGVAAVHVQNAPGVYGGRNVTILVVDFAVRS